MSEMPDTIQELEITIILGIPYTLGILKSGRLNIHDLWIWRSTATEAACLCHISDLSAKCASYISVMLCLIWTKWGQYVASNAQCFNILQNSPSTCESIEYLTTDEQLVTCNKTATFTSSFQLTWQNIVWWYLFLLMWRLSSYSLETQSTG